MKRVALVVFILLFTGFVFIPVSAQAHRGDYMTETPLNCTVTGTPGAGVFCSLTPDAGKTGEISRIDISWTAPTVTVDVHAILYNVLPHGQMYVLHEIAGVSGSFTATFDPALDQASSGNISASVSPVAMMPPNHAGAVTLTLTGEQE